MALGKQLARTIGLVLILVMGLAYFFVSFHPRLRFADPIIVSTAEFESDFLCYHDKIYGHSSTPDVLYFGASKTEATIDANLIGKVYEAVAGVQLEAFSFFTPISNPEIMYFFFRDYLAHNPAPEMVFFELTSLRPVARNQNYLHPLAADLAPVYLYLDVLRSWDEFKQKLFAASYFVQLFFVHIERSLARLLMPDQHFVVPPGNNCLTATATVPGGPIEGPLPHSFDQLLDAEMERLSPYPDREDVDRNTVLLDAYADDPSMQRRLKRALDRREENPNLLANWKIYGDTRGGDWSRKQSLDYYRRIVALARDHDVKIAFYYLPIILAPEPREDDIRQLSNTLGATLHILPYRYVWISYHHYMDGLHVKPGMRPAFAAWFASLIDKARTN